MGSFSKEIVEYEQGISMKSTANGTLATIDLIILEAHYSFNTVLIVGKTQFYRIPAVYMEITDCRD